MLPTVGGTGGERRIVPFSLSTLPRAGRGPEEVTSLTQFPSTWLGGADIDLRPSQVRAFTCMISSKHHMDEDTVRQLSVTSPLTSPPL